MSARSTLIYAALIAATTFAVAPALGQQAPALTPGGGLLGTGLGRGAGAAGAQTISPLANRARSSLVVSGTGHIGAGTGGLGGGVGNVTGGINNPAFGAPLGGLADTNVWGSGTGGVSGVGRGLGAGSGGLLDTDGAGTGINTGGINGSSIGAGTGGLADLNSLGATTGGKNDNNFQRFRVKYFNR